MNIIIFTIYCFIFSSNSVPTALIFDERSRGNIFTVDYSLVNEDDDCIYMCGNSLGLMLKSTRKYMDIQFEKWANMLVLFLQDCFFILLSSLFYAAT